jgi:EAL domain-containing protein (putative c-di-GMP-specific phosphodiesterase class I)
MAMLDVPVPIEADESILRARKVAAVTRLAMGMLGIALILSQPKLLPHPALGAAGFGIIEITSLVQLAAPRLSWLTIEESLSGSAGLLIIGWGSEHVSVLAIFWLVAVASGVLARGGRVHWVGRDVVVVALLLPIVRYGQLSAEYAGLLVAALGLLLTSGRLTRELNHLLGQARVQASGAETLLFAGDIATRLSHVPQRATGPTGADEHTVGSGSDTHAGRDRAAFGRILDGEGLSMVVQPIVDVRDGTVHGYEALARFHVPGWDSSPQGWFAMAEALGDRAALERACLREALALFARRPRGTSLSVNLSPDVLLESATLAMLDGAGRGQREDLSGLIIELTEETLVRADAEADLRANIDPLRARGASLAVDDIGAGYSGLRQITAVLPRYLKLDRSLISDIDVDVERAALVRALASYATQVGSLLIAEGVETHAELSEIQRLGVPLVQGFYFGRPAQPWPIPAPVEQQPVTLEAGTAIREPSAHEVLQVSRLRAPAADATVLSK